MPALTPDQTLAYKRDLAKAAVAHAETKLQLKAALQQLEQRDNDLAALIDLKARVESYDIKPIEKGGGSNEGTLVVLASDWHAEEKVVKAQVSGLNEFNLEIAHARATRFFQATLRLTRLLQAELRIPNMVLALLGDFITGQIHGAENAESNLLLPNDAIVFAKGLLVSGIHFLLNHTSLNLVLPCHSGNHARTTHTTRFASENGHSLEFLMYSILEAEFKNEPRLKFQVAEGPHSYLQVYDVLHRFQHGHMVKYNGGVGGLTIPANKAIAQWDLARKADLDCFGHFHTRVNGPKFTANGSLIGYNNFALSIKAGFEKPQQEMFLIDKKRGKTCNWPILLE
jgi:hypothetical protein